jgi:hypothetical protein
MSGRSRRGRARGGGRSLGGGAKGEDPGGLAQAGLEPGGNSGGEGRLLAAGCCGHCRDLQAHAQVQGRARRAWVRPSPPSPSLRPLLPSLAQCPPTVCRTVAASVVPSSPIDLRLSPTRRVPLSLKPIPREESAPPPRAGFPAAVATCNSLATSVHPAQPPLLQRYNPYSNPPAAPPLVGWPRAVHTARLNREMSGLAFILEYVWRRRLDGRGLGVDCDCDPN